MNRRQFFSKTVLSVAAAGLSGFVARSVSQIGILWQGKLWPAGGTTIHAVLDKRVIYGKIRIPWSVIEAQDTIDRQLDKRMAELSDKHKKKAWSRIQGKRWARLLHSEMDGLIQDMQRSTQL